MTFVRFAGRQESKLVDLARAAVADTFPNPDRIDCPDAKLREDLALRRKRLKDHWDVMEHICTCSPCFSEHLALRRRLRRRSAAVKLGGLVLGAFAAYAAWTLYRQPVQHLTVAELRQAIPGLPGVPEVPMPMTEARLDYSNWSIMRAPGSGAPAPNTPVLTRGRLTLTIQLPTLTPPGAYRVTLHRGDGVSLVQWAARATVVRGATILGPMDVNTNTVRPGAYTLTVHRDGASEPREFSVRIE